jgi:tetratricopeptide (TPR) repeat protein
MADREIFPGRRRGMKGLAASAALFLLLSGPSVRPARADFAGNFQVGKEKFKDGPFGGNVAGLFNAMTGGLLFGRGNSGKGGSGSEETRLTPPEAVPLDSNAEAGRRARRLQSEGEGSASQGKTEASAPLQSKNLASSMGTAEAGAVPEIGAVHALSQKEMEEGLSPRKAGASKPPPAAVPGTETAGESFAFKSVAMPAMSSRKIPPQEAALISGTRQFKVGAFQNSLRQADRSLDIEKTPKAYLLRAVSLNKLAEARGLSREMRMGLFREAEESAREAVRLDPKDPASWEALAWAQLQLGKHREAADSSSKAIDLDPGEAMAYAIRAYAYQQLGDRSACLRDIEEAARLDPARFGEQARRYRSGERMFEPVSEDGGQMLESASAPRRRGPSWVEPALLAGLAGLVGILAAPFLRRRKPVLAAGPFPEKAPEALLAGKYRLLRVIGRGGMGEVWEAEDSTLGREVAVKKLAFGPEDDEKKLRESCLKEARILAALRHPNVVSIYDAVDDPSGLFLVFELVRGKTVHHLLAESRRLPLLRTREILLSACRGVECAHAAGVVHRDLKPANIMVTDEGFVKVMDFGIARRLGAAASGPGGGPGVWAGRTGSVHGTPAYMAPEAAEGVVTPAQDVYSLGVCLYEMLTGELPFLIGGPAGAPPKAASMVPGLPPAADEIIARSLEPSYRKRMESVKDFRRALEALQA